MNNNPPPTNVESISSADQLFVAVQNVDQHVGESLARKYVARHRQDPHGWRLLISCTERNDNFAEAVRLASEMLTNFSDSAEVTAYAAAVCCNHGAYEQAFSALKSLDDKLDPRGAVLLGQLYLLEDPEKARELFEKVKARGDRTLEATLGVANAQSLSMGQDRPVGFLLFLDWHRPIQQSSYEAAVRQSMRCFMTTTPWLVRALAPDVLVVSDAQGLARIRSGVPDIKIVHTRHGLGDKNYGYFAAAASDFVCVSSQAIAEEYVRKGMFPRERFWVTGYAQLDPLFSGSQEGVTGADGRTVLFAPTFGEGLSAGLALGGDAVRRIRGDDTSIRVILRPHPLMREMYPALLNEWNGQSLILKNVEFNADPNADIGSLMRRSSVMISDVSSIALSYLALDRPIICLELGADKSTSPNFAPDGVEWRMREAAEIVSADNLAKAVAAALADPQRGSSARRELREYLFADTLDGRAGERIVQRIADLKRHA